MALYITRRGKGCTRKIWTPGDSGQPNAADTKEELFSFCPRPVSSSCSMPECLNLVIATSSKPYAKGRSWRWQVPSKCSRCNHLETRHHMTLTELAALWEEQERQCGNKKCRKTLLDPRSVSGRKMWKVHIDHDHQICPQASHSCKRCRRGLLCNFCNTQDYAIRKAGLWILPQGDELDRWLKFIGPDECNRLREALAIPTY